MNTRDQIANSWYFTAFEMKMTQMSNFHETPRANYGSNYQPILTQMVPKEAIFIGLLEAIYICKTFFDKIFCLTLIAGRQKFVQKMRMYSSVHMNESKALHKTEVT